MIASPGTPVPKTLSGRNCLLGTLSNHTFTCIASFSDTEAVVGSDTGALCLLSEVEGNQKLSLVKYMEFGITSLAVDTVRESMWLGGHEGQIERFTFEALRSSVASSPVSVDRTSVFRKTRRESSITSMGFLSSHLVVIDAKRSIRLYSVDNLYDDGQQNNAGTLLPAHKDAVLGIRPLRSPNDLNAEFFTWSSGGAVNFWDSQGRYRSSQSVDLDKLSSGEDDTSNELKVVCATDNMSFFVTGDRLGVLR